MITLYGFGPAFGLPDPSPFVMKAEVLLKMSGQPYRVQGADVRKAPKAKLPYIDDEGTRIADSTFIRWHLEKKYGVDFDRGLSAEQRAVAWAFEKLLEDNLYWVAMIDRWVDDTNFQKGPAHFFRPIPAPLRPIVIAMVRRQFRRSAHGHGMGRHSREDVHALGARSIDAVAAYLGGKLFFMGAEPTGIDAAVFAFAAGILCPVFDTPMLAAAARHANLREYVSRMSARYYPEMKDMGGAGAAD